jgi:hypothetical protein
MTWSKYVLKALLTILKKVGGLILTPNGITIQTKATQSITKVILYLSLRAIKI